MYDEETGLYYLNARYYDPATGRFITEDTYLGELTDPLSLNLYAYVLGNPHKYWDPTGRAGSVISIGERPIILPNVKPSINKGLNFLPIIGNVISIIFDSTVSAGGDLEITVERDPAAFAKSSTAAPATIAPAVQAAQPATPNVTAKQAAAARPKTAAPPSNTDFTPNADGITYTVKRDDNPTKIAKGLTALGYNVTAGEIMWWNGLDFITSTNIQMGTVLIVQDPSLQPPIINDLPIMEEQQPFMTDIPIENMASPSMTTFPSDPITQEPLIDMPIEAENGPTLLINPNDAINLGFGPMKLSVPNPYGKLGGPAHQDMIGRTIKVLRDSGYTIRTERKIDTPDGFKPYRYADITATDPDTGEKWVIQVGKQTKGGLPVSRERKALDDLMKNDDAKPLFQPYNNLGGEK